MAETIPEILRPEDIEEVRRENGCLTVEKLQCRCNVWGHELHFLPNSDDQSVNRNLTLTVLSVIRAEVSSERSLPVTGDKFFVQGTRKYHVLKGWLGFYSYCSLYVY